MRTHKNRLTRQILFSFCLLGTSPIYSNTILEYHRLVNKAEIAITNNKYQSGLNFYKKAFQKGLIPFGQDLYNASICAIKSANYIDAIAICKKLSLKGVGSKFFGKSVYDDLKLKKEWPEILRIADSVKKILVIKNNDLIQTCRELDKVTANNKENWINTHFSELWLHKMEVAIDSSSQILMQHFELTGYPTEEEIGVNVLNDTSISKLPIFGTIILSAYAGFDTWGDTLFSPILRNAMNSGKIKPETFAFFYDSNKNLVRQSLGTYNFSTFRCRLYSNKKVVEKWIDKLRKTIGLFGLNDYAKKIAFKINQPESQFLIFIDCPSQDQSLTSEKDIVEYTKTRRVRSNKIINCNI